MVDTYPYDLTTVTVNARAGQVSPEKDFEVVEINKATGAGTDYAAGDLLMTDQTNGGLVAGTSGGAGPFAVVNTPCLTTDTKANVIIKGWVVVKAGGAIKPNKAVMLGGSNKVIAYTDSGNQKVFGVYMYKPGEDDISHAASDAADNDLIIVKMSDFGGKPA